MGTNECSQPASKSSWDSQDFGDVNMVLKMLHFHKSSRPQWVNNTPVKKILLDEQILIYIKHNIYHHRQFTSVLKIEISYLS